MAEDFWDRATKGEQDFWLSKHARATVGDAEKRREFWKPYLDFLQRHAPLDAGARVLDVGCGPTGILTAMDPACERHGVDPLLDVYRDNYPLAPDISYSQQMGERLDFPDAFFHVATCINALDHTRSPADVLREIARVLQPGGHLLLEVDVYRGYEYYHKRFRRWLRVLRRRIEKHPHTFRASDIHRVAARLGLELVEQALRPAKKHALLLALFRKPPPDPSPRA